MESAQHSARIESAVARDGRKEKDGAPIVTQEADAVRSELEVREQRRLIDQTRGTHE